MKTFRPHTSFFERLLSFLLAVIFALPGGIPLRLSAAPVQFLDVAVRNAYDGNGNLVRRVDGNGAVTDFTYDPENRLLTIDYPGGSAPDVEFTYDANGNRTAMQDATGHTAYDYDQYDRLASIIYPDLGFVFYDYDKVGNIVGLSYGNLRELLEQGTYTRIRYAYDENNQMVEVRNDFTGDTTRYTYDASGKVSRRTLPNGVTSDHGYDADGRLTSLIHRKADNSRIVGFSYTLNTIGNRTSMTETLPGGATRVTAYTYDQLERLDTVTYPDGRFVNYDYDSFGNRTKLTETIGGTTSVRDYAYDHDSRLLSTTLNGVPEETFAYDQIGNLLQRARATDNRQINYVYDVENRLVRYFDGTNNVEYLYNGVGERIGKSVNGVRTSFINDPNRQYIQVLAETDSAGVAARVYEWGNELLNQEDIKGAERNYYLHDSPMGSVRRLVDSSGLVVNSYEFDAFGHPIAKVENVVNAYQFHGEAQEAAAAVIFLRARFVDPDSGRFLSRDPDPGNTVNPATLNPYAFVNNDPINARDPSGNVLWYIPGVAGSIWGAGLYVTGVTRADDERISLSGFSGATLSGFASGYSRPLAAIGGFVGSLGRRPGDYRSASSAAAQSAIFGGKVNWGNSSRLMNSIFSKPNRRFGTQQIASGILGRYVDAVGDSYNRWSRSLSNGRPGGVALDKSASVQLDINSISGGTFDPATGQILLFGKADSSPTALPPMDIDDLAVAFHAVTKGTMPVVSIEDPVVSSPPEWPGREAFTVRYGPFFTDPADGQTKVLDVSSKTHFGWVMFEADRLMKCLGLGKDNRNGASVSSAVAGYQSNLQLAWAYPGPDSVTTRYWFNPKEIVIKPSADGKSMELKRAVMQLSTETMFASNGQVESTGGAEYFSRWMTDNYDALAEEQVTLDDQGQPHHIFKELKQLAALVGVVKWVQDNNLPLDLSFLASYAPKYFDSAPSHTPQTSVSESRTTVDRPKPGQTITTTRTVSFTGGVNYCKDLEFGANGDPAGLSALALNARAAETNLAWSFQANGQSFNVVALSVDRKEKDGGFSHSTADATFEVQGSTPLVLGRHFDSFNVRPTMFGHGWEAQPYVLEFKSDRTKFNLCARQWEGYGEVYFTDRGGQRSYKMVPSGVYDRAIDPLRLTSRFQAGEDILVYRFETKEAPGLLFSDNVSRMVLRMVDGTLAEFDLEGRLLRTEDRNGNQIAYVYDAGARLVEIGQPAGRKVVFKYDAQNRVNSASLPDGGTMSYSYDDRGNLVLAQRNAPGGWRMSYTYNADRCLEEIRDENGQAVESRTYDVYGRVNSTRQPGVSTPITQDFSLKNRTTTTTGPENVSQTVSFNATYDPVRITDARANSTQLTYNQFRDVISERTADGRITKRFYDGRGNQVGVLHPNGRADMVFYDIYRNPIVRAHSSRDAKFDGSFDVDQVLTDYNGGFFPVNFTAYKHDHRGNATNVVDANSHTRTSAYDERGNRTVSVDGRGNSTRSSYDDASRLTRVGNAQGEQVDYSYDDRDNLARLTTAAGNVDYGYNAKNQRTSVTTGDAEARRTHRYTYDAKGSLKTVTDPLNVLTEYSYDLRGNLSQIRHDGIVRFGYDYDGLNRLVATRYTGTSGGGRPSVIPISPNGGEEFRGDVVVRWLTSGDWGNQPEVTLQMSADGAVWSDIATVASASGEYLWRTGNLVGERIQVRFVRKGDPTFASSVVAPFKVLNGAKFYVNDADRTGDEYCTAAGSAYVAGASIGTSPGRPANSLRAIIDNYTLQAGDTVHVDTGQYRLNEDIVIMATDSGTKAKPVRITGPLKGSAWLVHSDPAKANGCIVLNEARGVLVENLKLSGADDGIFVVNSMECTLRNLESATNGLPGAPGRDGRGSGILVIGGGGHEIIGNDCHHNRGNGGDGNTAGMNGGMGRGFGIYVVASSFNRIEANRCYRNSGTGGRPGAGGRAGYSEGNGIQVQSATDGLAEGNVVVDNRCWDNDGTGIPSNSTWPSIFDGGAAGAFGIAMLGTQNSILERNVSYNNWADGGRSWNGKAGARGGTGAAYGIYALGEKGLVLTKNASFNNRGAGDYGGDGPQDAIGEGKGYGVFLRECEGVLVKNNRAYFNNGFTAGTFGSEPQGMAEASGIHLVTCTNAVVVNNTLYRNWVDFESTGTDRITLRGSEINVDQNSPGCQVANNICDSADLASRALRVDSSSKSGFASDHNLLFVHGVANLGQWGEEFVGTLDAWRQTSGQDERSSNLDPQFYDLSRLGNQDAGYELADFHLRNSSPAIDTGTLLTNVEDDGDGEARPAAGSEGAILSAQDIGFDEFVDSDHDGLADTTEKSITLTSSTEADTDRDGLPDAWEVLHELNPLSRAGADGSEGDPDGDGYSNFKELSGGTDPSAKDSIPPIPPVFVDLYPAGAELVVLEGESLRFVATAVDGNGESVGYSWKLDGASVGTGNTWTFATSDESSGAETLKRPYAIQLSATAGRDTLTNEWRIQVLNRNRTPLLRSLTNITVIVGETVRINPIYSDPDNENRVKGDDNQLRLEITGWMNGLSKTTTAADLGQQRVTVRVADDGKPPQVAEQTIQVAVMALPVDPGVDSVELGLEKLADGSMRLRVRGASGSYVIEQSSDLVRWTDFVPVTVPATGEGGADDPDGFARSQVRFYRARRL